MDKIESYYDSVSDRDQAEVHGVERLGGRVGAGADDEGLTRRQLAALGGRGALALSGASLLAACGSTATTSTGTMPKRGGTVTMGIVGGGSAETVSPALEIATVDNVRTQVLFDSLVRVAPDMKSVVPWLALSADPNTTATMWTFPLRKGVTFHDGRPFTAADAVWTIKTWANPKHLLNSLFKGIIDFSGVRALDTHTLRVPLLLPIAQFPYLLAPSAQPGSTGMIPNGTNPTERAPIGTGPFKYESFTPGQQSVFLANRDWWQHGRPYIDRLVIVSSFSDNTALSNALLGGTLNVVNTIAYTAAKQLRGNPAFRVLSTPSPNGVYFEMRVDKGPFADVRVRQAFRLIANRPALVEGALLGFGTVGNDLYAQGTRYFDSSLHRSQDIEQAKSLLKAAGQTGMTVRLPTTQYYPALVPAATLFAQQAAAAGVKVIVDTISPSAYFTPAAGYTTRPFASSTAAQFTSMTHYYLEFSVSNAPYNETHWGSKTEDKMVYDAMSALDPSVAQARWNDVQQLKFNTGGELIWGNTNYLDAVASNVHGASNSPAGSVQLSLHEVWIA